MSAPQLVVEATGERGETYRIWKKSTPKVQLRLCMHYKNMRCGSVYYLMDEFGSVLRTGIFECTWWTEQNAREAVRVVLDEFFPDHEIAWR